MDLIDFCHENLAEISCDTVSSDIFRLENLIAISDIEKGKGFKAESFVRPPISLTVEFKNPIKLSHLELQSPDVGRVDLQIKASEDHFNAGRGDLTDGNLTFKNYRFLNNSSASLDQRPPCERRICIPRDQQSVLYNCRGIKLTIVYTKSPTGVASLKNLRIFGLPRNRGDWEVWKGILKRKKDLEKQSGSGRLVGFFGSDLNDQDDCGKVEHVQESAAARSDQVPDEFLDKLTFELMQVPMVLPSGQVVDKKNLDKHNENEARYGRPPSDPFTGKPFSEECKPIFDHRLKSRIDRFSMNKHGLDFARVKRRNLEVVGQRGKRPRFDRCSTCDESADLFLPCDHGLCRRCALKLPLTSNCRDCGVTFNKREVEKRHAH